MKGRISLPQVVKYSSSEPCRMFGMYPQKGSLEPGTDADIVIIDPEKTTKIDKDYSRGASDYSCYEGMELQGRIEQVFLRGTEIVKDGEFLGKKGDGRYLRRGDSILCAGIEPEGIKILEEEVPAPEPEQEEEIAVEAPVEEAPVETPEEEPVVAPVVDEPQEKSEPESVVEPQQEAVADNDDEAEEAGQAAQGASAE